MNRSITVICLLVTAACRFAGAQAGPAEAWMLYEEGNSLFEQREFGKALQRYKDAVAMAGILPEAEAAIGDVYREEGELDLARSQYEKAYNHRNSLVVPAARYDILYRLVEIHRGEERYRQMEDALQLIVADDGNWGRGDNARQRDQIEANLYNRGLDQVLRLYRFDPSFAARAHSELGWFYYRTGRFPQSAVHLLYAVIYAASEVARDLRERDVEWEFTSFERLLQAVDADRTLRDFAVEAGLCRDLYYLAGSTYACMYPKLAASIWTQVSLCRSAADWAELSKRQLRKPWIEPYLIPRGGTKP